MFIAMMKELDVVRDLIEEEYKTYEEQLSEAEALLQKQENKIREQERFVVVLEQEKETKSEFLSAYNSDDTVLHRIKEETEKKQRMEDECQELRDKIYDLSEKNEKYKLVLEQLSIVDQKDNVVVSEQLLKEVEDVLNIIVSENAKELKSFAKAVEEYMYVDPERVKMELQKYMKEINSTISKVRSIKKKLKED